MDNIQDTCALLHGYLFGTRLNIASIVLMQSGDHKTKHLFSPVYSFVKNVIIGADFKLYVNPGNVIRQNLFGLSGIRQMLPHKCRAAI